MPFNKKKELLDNMTKTVTQRLDAEKLALQAELGQAKLDLQEKGLMLREKRLAQGQVNPTMKPAEMNMLAARLQTVYGKDMLDVDPKDKNIWKSAAQDVGMLAKRIAKEQGVPMEQATEIAAEQYFKKAKTGGFFGTGLFASEGYKYTPSLGRSLTTEPSEDTGAKAGKASASGVPQGAIDELIADPSPENIASFNKYWPGQAEKILGGKASKASAAPSKETAATPTKQPATTREAAKEKRQSAISEVNRKMPEQSVARSSPKFDWDYEAKRDAALAEIDREYRRAISGSEESKRVRQAAYGK
jgi:hypothetical protein